jgi:hypothetical protein
MYRIALYSALLCCPLLRLESDSDVCHCAPKRAVVCLFIHSLCDVAVSDLDYVTLNDRLTEFFFRGLDLCVPSLCGVEVIVALYHTQTHYIR